MSEETNFNDFKFTGLWTPKEIILDTKLSWLQKNMWSVINSMQGNDGCFASDKYLSELFNVHPKHINRAIKGLIDLGYVIKIRFDGKKRYLKTTMQIRGNKNVTSRGNKNVTAGVTKMLPYNKGDNKGSIYKKENKEKKAKVFITLENKSISILSAIASLSSFKLKDYSLSNKDITYLTKTLDDIQEYYNITPNDLRFVLKKVFLNTKNFGFWDECTTSVCKLKTHFLTMLKQLNSKLHKEDKITYSIANRET